MEENEFEEFILVDVGWLGNRMKEKHIPSMTQISIDNKRSPAEMEIGIGHLRFKGKQEFVVGNIALFKKQPNEFDFVGMTDQKFLLSSQSRQNLEKVNLDQVPPEDPIEPPTTMPSATPISSTSIQPAVVTKPISVPRKKRAKPNKRAPNPVVETLEDEEEQYSVAL